MLFDLLLSLLYLFILVAASFVSLWTIQLTQERAQRTHARDLFALHSVAMLFTLLAYLGIALSRSDETAEFFARLRFAGIALIPPIWLRFTLLYSGAINRRWSWRGILLYILPTISVIFALFAPLHWWFQSWDMQMYGTINVEVISFGTYYYIHAAYSYLLGAISTYVMFRVAIHSLAPYRTQAMIMVAGIVFGAVVSIANAVRAEVGTWINYNALGFCLMIGAYGYAMVRYSFLHITPIAHETIINNFDTAVLVLDTQNTIVTLNPAARRTLKIGDADDVNGKLLKTVYPAVDKVPAHYRDAYTAQAEIAVSDSIFEVNIAPLYFKDGESKRLVGRTITWRDITERKLQERERERMITDLEAYSHTVAHDLKNPLHMMMAFNQMIGLDLIDSAPHIRHYLDLQMQSGLRMQNIIQDLLFLAQVRNQSEVVPESLPMLTLMQHAISGLEGEIRARSAEFNVPDSLPNALGVQPWLEQVWTNYLSNALKYGGTPPVIHISAETAPGGMIRYNVKDNGAGLTPEQCAKLFQQFVRLEPDRAPGTGLGLSIVQRIIERLGGRIGVECEPGSGCVFFFTLPAAPPSADSNAS